MNCGLLDTPKFKMTEGQLVLSERYGLGTFRRFTNDGHAVVSLKEYRDLGNGLYGKCLSIGWVEFELTFRPVSYCPYCKEEWPLEPYNTCKHCGFNWRDHNNEIEYDGSSIWSDKVH